MARILIVSFAVVPAPDRQGVHVVQLVRALASRHQVDCLTIKAGELGYVERFHRSRMLRVPVGNEGAPEAERAQAFGRAVNRQLDGAEYDVIHVRDTIGGLLALDRKREVGYRMVYEISGAISADTAPEAEGEQRCLMGADLVLAPTRTAMALCTRRGLSARTVFVPPGCDVDLFDWETRVPGPPLVLYVGRLAPTRGLSLLLRGFHWVLGRVPQPRLVLAGPHAPGFEPQLTAALVQLGIGGNVDRVAVIEHHEVSRLIARASVCVVPEASPDQSAPAPMKLYEYMACRRAIVAPRLHAIEDVARDGQHASLFTPGDPNDFAARVITLLLDPPGAERMAEQAYAEVRAHHAASATRRAVLEAYARLVPPDQPRDHTSTPMPAFALESSTARHTYDDGGATTVTPAVSEQTEITRTNLTVTGVTGVTDGEDPLFPELVDDLGAVNIVAEGGLLGQGTVEQSSQAAPAARLSLADAAEILRTAEIERRPVDAPTDTPLPET